MTPMDRFWKKVSQGSQNECWEFNGGRFDSQYGCFTVGDKKWPAHRFAWHITKGPIPKGFMVCHKCDNPPCCNPDHLFLGTCKDNLDDMRKKGRACKGSEYKRSSLTDKDVIHIRKTYFDGTLSYEDLAQIYDVTKTNIRLIVTGKIWKHLPIMPYRKPCIPKGERIGVAKLTFPEVVNIKKLLLYGHSQSEVANLMNTTKASVSHIARGRCWKHVVI